MAAAARQPLQKGRISSGKEISAAVARGPPRKRRSSAALPAVDSSDEEGGCGCGQATGQAQGTRSYTARDASTNSLSSLGSVSEDLEESMPPIQATPDSSFLMSLSRSGSDARLAPELVLPVTPPGSFKTILDSR